MALWCFRFLSGLALIVAMLSSSGGTSAQQFQNADLFSAWIFRTCAVHDDGKLEAALAQTGTQLVPAFVQAAQNGPDSSRLTQLHAKAAQQYDDIAAFLAGGDGPSLGLSSGVIQALQNVTRDDFIVEEVGNAVFNYQARALEGLGIVGGPVALQVLQSFANNTGSPLQPVAQQALANFAGPTTMAANITSKSGPSSARLWTVTFMNNGPAAAMGVQVNSVNLTQTFGAACKPLVTTPAAFPLSVGSIAPAGSGSTAITINFTGCPANARFTANISFSANSGTVTGTVIRYNQFE
jgi:hypothetical protein